MEIINSCLLLYNLCGFNQIKWNGTILVHPLHHLKK